MPETRKHEPDDSNEIANLVREALQAEEPSVEPITEAVEEAHISHRMAVTPQIDWRFMGGGGQ